MPGSKKPGWVEWKSCPARAVTMEDLRPGGPLCLRDNIPAEDIFPWHEQLPEFEKVVFGQFEARLKDRRMAAAKDAHRAMQEQQRFEHDRSLHPRQTHNERGELALDAHPAKLSLRQDTESKSRLLAAHSAPGKLQASRPERASFKPQKLGGRARQEIRLQRCLHCLKKLKR